MRDAFWHEFQRSAVNLREKRQISYVEEFQMLYVDTPL